MSRRRRLVVLAMIFGVPLLLFGVWRCTPLWPGPALPAGATRLHIETATPDLLPSFGCPAALLGPIVVTTAGDEMVFISDTPSGQPVRIVWPSGWAAWREDGRGVLRDRDGAFIAYEGDTIQDRFGGGVGLDDAFHVCVIGG